MQITCFVNQTEAIRRGHDTNSTVKLEVNPADLSQEQRDALAAKFNNGNYTAHSFPLPEPTLHGLLESLDAVAVAAETEAVARAKALQEDWAKFDADPRSQMWFASSYNTAHLIGRLKDAEITNERKAVFDNIKTEMTIAHQKKTSERREVEDSALRERELQKAEQKVATDNFRKWATERGSPTLRLRVKEGYQWETLAAEEWTDKLLSAAGGVISSEVDAQDGYDVDVYTATAPSLSEMRELSAYRKALLKELSADEFELSLHNVTYTEEDPDDGEAEVIKQTELKVCIHTPNGGCITKFFKV